MLGATLLPLPNLNGRKSIRLIAGTYLFASKNAKAPKNARSCNRRPRVFCFRMALRQLAVEAAEQPNQKNNRQRNTDQPKQ